MSEQNGTGQPVRNGRGAPSTLKRSLLVLGAAFGLGIVFDLLFYKHMAGLGFPLYIALVLGCMAGLAHAFRLKLPRSTYALMVPTLFFAAMVFVRTGELVTFLNVAITMFLLVLVTASVFRPALLAYRLADYVRPIGYLPERFMDSALRTVKDLGVVRSFVVRHKHAPQVVRGVAIAVPVLLLFGALFASADLVFRKYMGEVFNLHLNGDAVIQTLLALWVGTVFTGLFSYLALWRLEERAGATETPARPAAAPAASGITETVIVFGALNLLFLSFIAVQLKYLFGGAQNVIGQGFTYAQYARKGFFELIAVAVVAFLLVLAAERLLGRRGSAGDRRFKLLAVALVAQVLLVMVSAFKRLALYESAYGFTSLRLYSHIFIVWLAVVFGILLYKILRNRRESTFAFLTLLSVLALFATINVMNVDRFVAHQNLARYRATGKLDTGYLRNLSDDAVPELVTALRPQPGQGAPDHLLVTLLRDKHWQLQHQDHSWQSQNLARDAARKALDDNARYLRE